MLCLQDLSEHLDTTGRFDLIYIVNREGGREGGREVWPKSTPLDGGGVGGQTNLNKTFPNSSRFVVIKQTEMFS